MENQEENNENKNTTGSGFALIIGLAAIAYALYALFTL